MVLIHKIQAKIALKNFDNKKFSKNQYGPLNF